MRSHGWTWGERVHNEMFLQSFKKFCKCDWIKPTMTNRWHIKKILILKRKTENKKRTTNLHTETVPIWLALYCCRISRRLFVQNKSVQTGTTQHQATAGQPCTQPKKCKYKCPNVLQNCIWKNCFYRLEMNRITVPAVRCPLSWCGSITRQMSKVSEDW